MVSIQKVSSTAEPSHLPSKPFISRGMSFNAETGEKESSQVLWESSSWERLGRSRGRTMDRSNSFVGKKDEGIKETDKAIAVVDPFSTGAHLAVEVRKLGYKCIRVFSVWDSPVANLVQQGLEVDFVLPFNTMTVLVTKSLLLRRYCIDTDNMKRCYNLFSLQTAQSLRDLPYHLVAVIPGAETGVELADQLSFRLNLRTNGVEKSLARRNKYIMGEMVRNAG